MENEKCEDDNNEEESNNHPGLGIRHLQVAMMLICATMLYMVRSSIAVAILAMTDVKNANSTSIEIYEWSEEVRGVILSSFFWGYTVMQIPAGILGKKFGGKPLLQVALVANGVMCFATPTLARFGGWVAVCSVRVIMGLTQACFMPCYHTIIGKWAVPEERTRFTTFSYAGIQIGTILAMPISGVISHTSYGWKLIFYVMGALTLITSVLWWAFTASSPEEHRLIKHQEKKFIENSLPTIGKETDIPIPWRKILTCPTLYVIAFAHISANWSFMFFLVEVPTYLKNGLGINLANSATLSALPFIGQWLWSMISSVICEYIYNHKILTLTNTRKLFNTIGAVGMAAGFIVLSFMNKDQKWLAVFTICFTSTIFGTMLCAFMVNHIDLSPNYGGLLFSLTNFGANLVGMFMPLVAGFILGEDPTDITRWRILFFLCAGLITIANIIYVLFTTSELQSWNSPEEKIYKPGVLKIVDQEMNKYEFSNKET